MSKVSYHAFCGSSQNTVLTLCLLSRHVCMINAAKGCLCANHVLPLCFMKENTYLVPYFVYLMMFVRPLCRPHLMPFRPLKIFLFSPAVVLCIFTPYVGSVLVCELVGAYRARCVNYPDLPPPRMLLKGKRPEQSTTHILHGVLNEGTALPRRLRTHNIQQRFGRCPLILAKRSPQPRQQEVLPISNKPAFLKALYRVLPMP